MKPSLEAKIISNFMLYVDHQITQKGEAFTNYSSQFYPVESDINGKYAYSAPFKQLVNDTSISGATVLSGLYINGAYNPIGVSGLSFVNHYKGTAYFDHQLQSTDVVSGNYSVKDFSVELSDQPEYHLLFETKYQTNGNNSHPLSGLSPEEKTAPIIYILSKGQDNEPFGFSHMDRGVLSLRCLIIADTEYESVGACSILKNIKTQYLPMLKNLPFDSLGNVTGVNFSYDTNTRDTSYTPYISFAHALDIAQKGDYENIVKNIASIDVEIETVVQN